MNILVSDIVSVSECNSCFKGEIFQPSLFLISFSPSYGVPMVWNLSDNYVLLRSFFILKMQCTVKHFCICRKMKEGKCDYPSQTLIFSGQKVG